MDKRLLKNWRFWVVSPYILVLCVLLIPSMLLKLIVNVSHDLSEIFYRLDIKLDEFMVIALPTKKVFEWVTENQTTKRGRVNERIHTN